MIFKNEAFKKGALVCGILVIIIWGLANTADVALYFFPESFLELQMKRTGARLIKMRMNLDRLEATLTALQRVREHGFSFVSQDSLPSQIGVEQAIKRTSNNWQMQYDDRIELDYLKRRLEKQREVKWSASEPSTNSLDAEH